VPPSDIVSSTLHLAVLSGYVAVVAALSVVGYWYAVRRIDRYTL
jgi:lysozyme family protein